MKGHHELDCILTKYLGYLNNKIDLTLWLFLFRFLLLLLLLSNDDANVIDSIFLFTGQYIDLDYSIWLWRALTPLIITFMLPMVFVLLIYLSSCFLYIYKLHR